MQENQLIANCLSSEESAIITNDVNYDDVKAKIRTAKIHAVSLGDNDTAKELWCAETILETQHQYLLAFQNLRLGKFYEAWCLLERTEISLHCLEGHFHDKDSYKLQFIETHTKQFQSLFPYKYFLSPGFLIHESQCSICEQPMSIRNPCKHILGEIYEGEMCCRRVTKSEFLEISLVKNPVQKYSVPFTKDPKTGEQVDQYDYSLVRYVVRGLHGPFDAWDCEWTKTRHPHSRYKHIGRNEKCPCESGKKYKKCCLNELGVLRPNLEVRFSVPPPPDLPPIMYTS